jgi:hypothetical protein
MASLPSGPGSVHQTLRRAELAEERSDNRAAVVLYGDAVRTILAAIRGANVTAAEREELQLQARGAPAYRAQHGPGHARRCAPCHGQI